MKSSIMDSSLYLKIFVLLCLRMQLYLAFVQIPTISVNNINSVIYGRRQEVRVQTVVRETNSDTSNDTIIPDSCIEDIRRYAKKSLISVGRKGATIKHGNNLRQLLNDHTIVKVKFNTQTFGTLEQAFTSLRDLAVESGASQSIELIEMKQNERTIIFGLPGTKGKIKDGSFPPPPPPPYERQPEETTEDDEQSDE